jgi:group I intron endonuclease
MNKCGIYLIRNAITGKVYVGSSIDIRSRWRSHICLLNGDSHSNAHLQASWNVHGKNAFEFTIIEECSEGTLMIREMVWIAYYDAMNRDKGYNIEYPDRHEVTEETKRKISEANMGHHHNRGWHHSEETKQRLSESKNGNQWNKGKHHSEETKHKMSESMMGHPSPAKTEEGRRRISEAHKGNQYNKGRITSEETKQKQSESHRGLLKGTTLSEEHKRKLSISHQGKVPSEETRRILSKKTQAYWERKRRIKNE